MHSFKRWNIWFYLQTAKQYWRHAFYTANQFGLTHLLHCYYQQLQKQVLIIKDIFPNITYADWNFIGIGIIATPLKLMLVLFFCSDRFKILKKAFLFHLNRYKLSIKIKLLFAAVSVRLARNALANDSCWIRECSQNGLEFYSANSAVLVLA